MGWNDENINSSNWEKRFWSQVDKTDACWNWKGYLDRDGYGHAYWGKPVIAHRISLKINRIDLIPGLVVDHLCKNRKCVNPSHLRQVTTRENVLCSDGIPAKNLKKISCYKGHLFTEKNTYRYRRKGGNGQWERECRICRKNAVNRSKINFRGV